MASKRKHVTLDLAQKLEILEMLKQGCSHKAIVAQFNVGRATIYDIKKKEDQLQKYTSRIRDGSRKVMRRCSNDQLDEAVYRWFLLQRNQGLPVSGPMVREKAIQFNKALGSNEQFGASDGWLSKWKKRHGVRRLTMPGESRSSNENNAEGFKKQLETMIKIKGLSPAAVYNAAETGLLFRKLPWNTLNVKEASRCNKRQMEGVTLMACSNGDGSHKLPLLVVGRSEKPPGFRHIQMCTLPVYYRSRKNAKVDSEIISWWFNDKFVPAVTEELKAKRLPLKAILIIDDSPGHLSELSLTSGDIRTIFLPTNFKTLIQPMDEGILELVKCRYRHVLLTSMLYKCENGSNEDTLKVWKAFNMLDVVFQTAEAWDNVDSATIVKCWKNILPSIYTGLEMTTFDNDKLIESESSIPNNEFVEMFHRLPGGEDVDGEDVKTWLNEDNFGADQEEEILQGSREEEEEGESGDEEDVVEEVSVKISHNAGAEAADIFLQYIMQQPDTCSTDVMLVKRLHEMACRQRTSSLRTGKNNVFHDRN